MRSVMCTGCGLVGWAESGNCKRCGQPFPNNQQSPRVSAPPQDYNAGQNHSAGYDYNHAQTTGDSGAATKKRKGYAVASLVIGILGFFTFGILLIGTIIGTSFGIAALTKQGKQPNVYGGKGLAIAGIVLNIAALCMIVPLGIISAIAIPNLLASRRAANEAAAISNLRVINNAEATYASTMGAGSYGSLSQLYGARMIDEKLASGAKYGYVFTVTATGNSFEARATPLTRSNGNRSFYLSSDGVIHWAEAGRVANESDPPVGVYGPQYDSQTRYATSQPDWQSSAPAY